MRYVMQFAATCDHKFLIERMANIEAADYLKGRAYEIQIFGKVVQIMSTSLDVVRAFRQVWMQTSSAPVSEIFCAHLYMDVENTDTNIRMLNKYEPHLNLGIGANGAIRVFLPDARNVGTIQYDVKTVDLFHMGEQRWILLLDRGDMWDMVKTAVSRTQTMSGRKLEAHKSGGFIYVSSAEPAFALDVMQFLDRDAVVLSDAAVVSHNLPATPSYAKSAPWEIRSL